MRGLAPQPCLSWRWVRPTTERSQFEAVDVRVPDLEASGCCGLVDPLPRSPRWVSSPFGCGCCRRLSRDRPRLHRRCCLIRIPILTTWATDYRHGPLVKMLSSKATKLGPGPVTVVSSKSPVANTCGFLLTSKTVLPTSVASFRVRRYDSASSRTAAARGSTGSSRSHSVWSWTEVSTEVNTPRHSEPSSVSVCREGSPR